MWIVMSRREPAPDALHWPGRRLLAALDAVAWPALGMAAAVRWAVPGGLVSVVLVTVLAIAAARRLRRAIWRNHRYRFTTWRWIRALLALAVFALLFRWILYR